MGVIETKAFKSGNSVAVRLPKELGIAAGTPLRIERVGDKLKITKCAEGSDGRSEMQKLADEIEAIWAGVPSHPDRGQRERIIIPTRRGL